MIITEVKEVLGGLCEAVGKCFIAADKRFRMEGHFNGKLLHFLPLITCRFFLHLHVHFVGGGGVEG